MSLTSVLKNQDFRRLWLGQAISQLGDHLYYLIFAFIADALTRDSRIVSTVLIVQALPFLVFGPLAGAFADRFDRRRIMLFCDLASTAILASASLFVYARGEISLPLIYFLAVTLSLVNVFFGPAKSASIPTILGPQDLVRGNSLSSATENLIPIIGISLSSTMMTLLQEIAPRVSFSIALGFNALSFLVSAAYIWRLPRLVPERSTSPENYWREIRAGLSYLKNHTAVKTLVLVNLWRNFFIAPFYMIYLATNRLWFGGKFWTLGLMEVSFFVAMALTSIWIGKHPVAKISRPMVLASIVTGLLILVMGVSKNLAPYALWNMLCGFAVPYCVLPADTFIQSVVPDEFRGRVNSTRQIANQGVQPISLSLAGQLLSAFGLAPMYWVMGFGFALSGLWIALSAALRNAELPAHILAGAKKS